MRRRLWVTYSGSWVRIWQGKCTDWEKAYNSLPHVDILPSRFEELFGFAIKPDTKNCVEFHVGTTGREIYLAKHGMGFAVFAWRKKPEYTASRSFGYWYHASGILFHMCNTSLRRLFGIKIVCGQCKRFRVKATLLRTYNVLLGNSSGI